MSSSLREFTAGLYQEHLEEASFLYEQRRALMNNPQFSWHKLGDFEARLEAHLDALVLGGTVALGMCKSRLVAGDAGELFASVCIVCRQGQAPLLGELWRTLDFGDGDKVRAVTDALKLEFPETWHASCQRALARGRPELLPILGETCGSRRFSLGNEIAESLLARPDNAAAAAYWALSRMSASEITYRALESGAQTGSTEVKSASVLGLLWHNKRNVLRDCHLWAESQDWPLVYLALAGVRSSVSALSKQVRSGGVTSLGLYAAGFLGDLSMVRLLSKQLDNEETAEAAAWALHWITGAPLYEETFVEETIDESELFDAEKRALRDEGKRPTRGDGKPFGVAMRRLSREQAVWDQWLAQNAARFDADIRYRFGVPHSPEAVMQGLSRAPVPRELRQWSYEELGIIYGCSIPFETDFRVVDQIKALRALTEWSVEIGSRLGPGEWH